MEKENAWWDLVTPNFSEVGGHPSPPSPFGAAAKSSLFISLYLSPSSSLFPERHPTPSPPLQSRVIQHNTYNYLA